LGSPITVDKQPLKEWIRPCQKMGDQVLLQQY